MAKGSKPSTDKPTRRDNPLKVYGLPEEKAHIKAHAMACGNTVSSYLLSVGMGYPIRSILDHQRVTELAKVNADLGRLGGLLKLWLAQDERLSVKNFPNIDRTIVAVLTKIDENQERLREIMRLIVQS
jgi:hypothetical protein